MKEQIRQLALQAFMPINDIASEGVADRVGLGAAEHAGDHGGFVAGGVGLVPMGDVRGRCVHRDGLAHRGARVHQG